MLLRKVSRSHFLHAFLQKLWRVLGFFCRNLGSTCSMLAQTGTSHMKLQH